MYVLTTNPHHTDGLIAIVIVQCAYNKLEEILGQWHV